VDTDTHGGEIGLGAVRALQREGEVEGVAWRVEGEEAPVAGPRDDAATRLVGQSLDVRAMAREQRSGDPVSSLRLERGRVCQVREDQGQDPRVVLRNGDGATILRPTTSDECTRLAAVAARPCSSFARTAPGFTLPGDLAWAR